MAAGASEKGSGRKKLPGSPPGRTCARCGAAFDSHEPLVIADAGEVRHSTLAAEPQSLRERCALYHPACYAALETSASPAGGEEPRVFAEALCGVDGSAASLAAVEQAARLVGSGGQLTILVVTSLRSGVGQMMPRDAMEVVERAAATAERAGVSCTVEVDPEGPVGDVVRDWAEGHALLALGAPPESRLAGMWLGGVDDAATGSLSMPMLLARPLAGDGVFGERMLVASDGQRGSEELVAFAGRLADEAGATLTLVHALGSRALPHADRRARVEAQLSSLAGGAPASEPAVIEPGGAQEAIAGACRRLGASLVVMSSRRRAGIVALGSVSRGVIHHGECSVLLVPPERLLALRSPGGAAGRRHHAA